MSRIIRIATRGPCPAHLCSLGKGGPVQEHRAVVTDNPPWLFRSLIGHLLAPSSRCSRSPNHSNQVHALDMSIPGLLITRIRSTSPDPPDPYSRSPNGPHQVHVPAPPSTPPTRACYPCLLPLALSDPGSFWIPDPPDPRFRTPTPRDRDPSNRTRSPNHSHQVQTMTLQILDPPDPGPLGTPFWTHFGGSEPDPTALVCSCLVSPLMTPAPPFKLPSEGHSPGLRHP